MYGATFVWRRVPRFSRMRGVWPFCRFRHQGVDDEDMRKRPQNRGHFAATATAKLTELQSEDAEISLAAVISAMLVQLKLLMPKRFGISMVTLLLFPCET